ncbi:RNA polymerase sigma factor [Candidatus Contubernalis alkaliaceticus]|uniref:RNA polymerase sigma factor n=1 Tax=Candidatus Contubernalis alkaliaceticus TaxID=338645 RepID=UPI001F4C3F2A|nr:RNA polymerase sigma factor [Candidatus Contubernalis alkalaceticus]UNC91233.1 RNA polymerase sigma factor [Candidatus Contubernalis alkalaceticus]
MQSSLLRTNEELSQIYNRHVKTVYRVCAVYMKNRHDTEDMVQNTFIRLMKDKTHFESEEHEKAWLIRTATNLCKDFFKNWWRKIVNIDTMAEVAADEPFADDDTLKKVMELPPKYKTIVYLYYYEGYRTKEIAKMLNINESTIRSQLATGRKILKIDLESDLK